MLINQLDMEDNAYRKQFNNLIKRPLFSYPFYEKTDEELISDAVKRNDDNLEFRLFKFGERDTKTVMARGKLVETRYFPLINLLNENETKPIEIKITSFKFPALLMSSVLDKEEKIRSTFNYQTFDEYYELYRSIEGYYGKRVLITTCWDAVTDFISSVKCVNIVPVTDDDMETAQIIRKCFLRDRRTFIEDILQKPKKYMNFSPVDEVTIARIFDEFKPLFIEELARIDSYSIPDDNSCDDYSTSQHDLDRDNFYALTDGQEGDYPSDLHRFDNDDDAEMARMLGF